MLAAADEAAACFGYTSEIASYIPGCAGVCFLSFLNANYEADDNGRTPTLNQLCTQTGKTGYTVGEGALQCITAEIEVGSCSDIDASGEFLRLNHAAKCEYNMHMLIISKSQSFEVHI